MKKVDKDTSKDKEAGRILSSFRLAIRVNVASLISTVLIVAPGIFSPFRVAYTDVIISRVTAMAFIVFIPLLVTALVLAYRANKQFRLFRLSNPGQVADTLTEHTRLDRLCKLLYNINSFIFICALFVLFIIYLFITSWNF